MRSFFGTRRQAEDALREFIDEIKKGVLVRDRKRTVGDYLTDWLAQKRVRLASKTYIAYKMHVRKYIAPAIGDIPLASLRKEHVRKAISAWGSTEIAGRKVSPRTVHHVFSTLRTALHDAQEDGLITVVPLGARMAPAKGKAEISALDETQVLALLDYLSATPIGTPTRVAIHTGLRRGELLALTWDAIDLERRVLHVRQAIELAVEDGKRVVRFKDPKTPESWREVALSALAIAALRSQRAEQTRVRLALGGAWGDENLVFPNPRTGKPWNPDTFSSEFLQRVAASGLPKVTFHGLRHSFASISLRAGTPLKVVSEMLGHTTTAITADLYTHGLGELKADAADRLDAIFEKAQARRVVSGEQKGSWAKCGPISISTSKKARQIRAKMVAPAGFEPALPP
ncbi:MAG: tyrosine-type recombinase/integrase [Vulcanimicrobiaceae bacterium]